MSTALDWDLIHDKSVGKDEGIGEGAANEARHPFLIMSGQKGWR